MKNNINQARKSSLDIGTFSPLIPDWNKKGYRDVAGKVGPDSNQDLFCIVCTNAI